MPLIQKQSAQIKLSKKNITKSGVGSIFKKYKLSH